MRGRRGKSFSKTSCNMETRHVRLAHPVSYRVLYGAAYYFPSLIITMFASSLSSESASLAHTTKSTRRRGAARLGATRLVFASNSTFVICITDRCLAAFVRWFGRSVAVAGDLEREPTFATHVQTRTIVTITFVSMTIIHYDYNRLLYTDFTVSYFRDRGKTKDEEQQKKR